MGKFNAHGATFEFNTQAVGGITSLSLPPINKGVAEVTDSDSGGVREKKPGLIDSGEIGVEGFYDDADLGQQELFNHRNDPAAVPESFKVVVTSPATGVQNLTGNAFVTAFEVDLPTADDDYATFSATLMVEQDVTYGAEV